MKVINEGYRSLDNRICKGYHTVIYFGKLRSFLTTHDLKKILCINEVYEENIKEVHTHPKVI